MHPSPLSAGGGGGWTSYKIFKREWFDRKRRGGGDVFKKGREPNFYMKNKSRIFNDKKSL